MQSGAKFPQEMSVKQWNTPLCPMRAAVSAPPTPLATLLASATKPPRLTEYRGTLTPREFDASAAEIAAQAQGAAAHDLGWMRRVAVHGEDRFRWLSGMVTNTVTELAAGTGAWNMVLNAQGSIQGDLTVWREEDKLELEIAADQYDRLQTHLERFIIMDDVELMAQDPTAETALGLIGPEADNVLARMGLPALPSPMTSTRVEWNGWIYSFEWVTVFWPHSTNFRRLQPDSPACGGHSRLLAPRQSDPMRWKHFALQRAFRRMESRWPSGTCRRRPRKYVVCTSAKVATLGRR